MSARGTRVGLALAGGSLAARLAVVTWGAPRFPAVEDGHYYDTFARRVSEGLGYTWLWPDGAITNAAHYPVGYPAMLAAAYAIVGERAWVAMALNALLGAAATLAVYTLVRGDDDAGPRARRAVLAAIVFALHPALLLYTPAVMTEGVTASLLAIAAALALRARTRAHAWRWRAGLAIVLGVATLVRPQSIVLAPALGWLSAGPALRARALAAGIVLAGALACCAPWTARNCTQMDGCVFVSANGGTNLLIGVDSDDGGWAPVIVPPACKEVWPEVAKDRCFGAAARAAIAAHPLAWIAKAPAKLAMTLDYFGAAGWYLHSANPAAFDDRAKIAAGVVETIASRALLVVALVACALQRGRGRRARLVLAAFGIVAACLRHAWPGYLALAAACAVVAWRPRDRAPEPFLAAVTAVVVVATAALHAVFFGAGRYGLPVVPFVTAAAFAWSGRRERVSPMP